MQPFEGFEIFVGHKTNDAMIAWVIPLPRMQSLVTTQDFYSFYSSGDLELLYFATITTVDG